MEKFVDINNGKELEEYLKNNMGLLPNSTLAVHGMKSSPIVKTGESILKDGLLVKGWGGIASTCEIKYDENGTDYQDLIDYSYQVVTEGNVELTCNVIVAFPKILTATDNKSYFLGDIDDTFKGVSRRGFVKGNDPSSDLPISEYVANIRQIPKEFILGYIITDTKNNSLFRPNENYIGLCSESERRQVADHFIAEIENQGIHIFDINQDKVSEYESYVEIYEKFGKNSIYLNQLIKECKNDIKNY